MTRVKVTADYSLCERFLIPWVPQIFYLHFLSALHTDINADISKVKMLADFTAFSFFTRGGYFALGITLNTYLDSARLEAFP